MRARLQKFLPVVLIALTMQVLAPIAACWAAGAALADPLQNAVVCHSAGAADAGPNGDRSGNATPHAGSCAICCLAHASASFAPSGAIFAIPFRFAAHVTWRDAIPYVVAPERRVTTQARAPPHLS